MRLLVFDIISGISNRIFVQFRLEHCQKYVLLLLDSNYMMNKMIFDLSAKYSFMEERLIERRYLKHSQYLIFR